MLFSYCQSINQRFHSHPRHRITVILCLVSKLTESNLYLLLYYFVSIVNLFNVRASVFPKDFAKLQTNFELTKFLFNFLTNFLFSFASVLFVPESECKVTTFLRTVQIFQQLFYALKHTFLTQISYSLDLESISKHAFLHLSGRISTALAPAHFSGCSIRLFYLIVHIRHIGLIRLISHIRF